MGAPPLEGSKVPAHRGTAIPPAAPFPSRARPASLNKGIGIHLSLRLFSPLAVCKGDWLVLYLYLPRATCRVLVFCS